MSVTPADYHQRTKHSLNRYARGPAALDWDDQPEAFRWFDGALRLELPFTADNIDTRYVDLYDAHPTPKPLNLDNLSAMLERSMGLAAWKQYGAARWALRCNPSSGNLHPTEACVISPGMQDLAAGVFHYLSRDHVLEQRCTLDAPALSTVLPPQAFLVGLSSIHWREAWKYGERAYRYCQHDCGHAIAALRYAAAALGWRLRLLDDCSDDTLAAMLGLDRNEDFDAAEPEQPDALLLVETRAVAAARPGAAQLAQAVQACAWSGTANRLSPYHYQDWSVIDAVADACRKPATPASAWQAPQRPTPLAGPADARATRIFLQRRSAQAFDGVTSISAATFYRMLDMTLPRAGVAPWDSLPWKPRIHLVLFVHRVEGIRAGLYVFARSREGEVLLRDTLNRTEFQWLPVDGCPQHLSLFSLLPGDARRVAGTLSCHQAIAADSAFSLGMLAGFDDALQAGPWAYRQMFWEAGMLGQVLYLEAEAAGVQGTGIGCYFDDDVHHLLGIEDARLQSLYHFTVGGALVDSRLMTLPPYDRLQRGGAG
ncbi:MAG: nitroreductase family protein [Thiogranum sp.]|nr:nitroreductase family protein [Thiogranum sp.]